MIARSFKSVIWVATVGGAALACYMVSLRVATERADLAKVEHQILAAKREIRMLQTELGTRGRMSQLEDWNANVLALSAPTSAQYVHDDVTLARLERRDATVADRTGGEMRMASAETGPAAQPVQAPEAPKPPRLVTAVAHPGPPPAQPALHQATYTRPVNVALADVPKPAPAKEERPAGTRAAKKPAPDKKAASTVKPAPEKKLATAKPVVAKKLAAAATRGPAKTLAAGTKRPAPKQLAHAKPAGHPAAQESDAD